MPRSRLLIALGLLTLACSKPEALPRDGSTRDAGPGPVTCADDPCPGERCVDEGETFSCVCPAGEERRDGVCTPLERCDAMTCDGRGACADDDGAITCACEAGYAGPRCGECAEGYARNHLGDCVTDLCAPSPCTDADRARCVVEGGAASCRCNAGTHEEGGACVPDTTCTDSTCSGRGTCVELDDAVACECGEGFAGMFCRECDAAGGYHDDGAGGCTTDACLPNPCDAPLETVCVSEGAEIRCECDPGAHREGDACVPDEVCEADTCAPAGTCAVVEGRAICHCDAGWDGARCDACAAGYHDDGAGGCTTDVCLPDPCTTIPNRSICVDDGGAPRCDCDPGYHDDGFGGCTTDPCTPDPCAVLGEACRDTGGVAECYVPECDDGEPCTDDAFVAGACRFTPRTDGASCSTSLCVTGQTCGGGVCGGGEPVVCEDGDPCTRGACDPLTGCAHVVDDTLIPDDGVPCTVDVCTSGVASHTPSDARCDDAAWCNGAELCAPTDVGADADGCLPGAPPIPPPSTPCRSYGRCDEATDTFPLTALATGASCDDSIACTIDDRCDAAGLCRGAPMATCPSGCTGAVPWTGAIDVGVGRITGSITIDGAPLPATTSGIGGFTLQLRNVETGQRHQIATPHYAYVSGGPYGLRGGSISAAIPPGLYDLEYERGYWNGSSSALPRVNRQEIATAIFPNGFTVLRHGVVIAAGRQTLDVDVPVARVTGSITVGGAPLPATTNGIGGFTLMLWDRETDQRHHIATPHYAYVSGGPYALRDGTVDAAIPPGTYDLVYERGYWNGSSSALPRVNRQETATATFPNGFVVLQEGVTIGAGAVTLDVDVPVAQVTGSITVGGAPLPATTNGIGGFTLMLWDRETDQRHHIATPHYAYVSGGPYALRDGTVDAAIPPGTYDLVYERGYWNGSSSALPRVNRQETATATFPNGFVVLQEGVTIGAGAVTLDVDVPVAQVTGSITVGGAPLPATTNGIGGFTLMLWDRETDQRHHIATPHYAYVSGGPYALRDGTVDAAIPPGTYDLLYERGYWNGSSSALPRVNRQETATATFPNGFVVLQEGVTIGAGAVTLDVDVPVARVTGSITVGGAPLPATTNGIGGFTLMLWDRETDQRHHIATPYYAYVSGGPYALRDGTVDAALPPGTYDLVYERGYWNGSSSALPRVNRQEAATAIFPNGFVVLRRGVTIGAGAVTLDVDVPTTTVSEAITVEGRPLPATTSGIGGFTLMLWDRETDQRHHIATPYYAYVSGGPYALRDGAVDAVIPPGIYDLLYERGYWNGSSSALPRVNRREDDGIFPNGFVPLRQCVVVP